MRLSVHEIGLPSFSWLTLSFLLLGATIVGGPSAWAQDQSITSDTTYTSDQTWSGEVEVTADVTVDEGITLTVESGTAVELEGASITVQGALDAEGAEGNEVTFTSAAGDKSAGDWKQIRFTDTSGEPASTIRHVEIEYATTGIQIEGVPEANEIELSDVTIADVSSRGIDVDGGGANLQQVTVRDFGDHGIRATGPEAEVTVTDALVEQQASSRVNTGTGVQVRDGADLTLEGSIIRKAGMGVYAYRHVAAGYSPPKPVLQAEENTISANNIGVRVHAPEVSGCCHWTRGPTPYPDVDVVRNEIRGNEDWNVRVDQGAEPGETELNFTENWWGTTDGVEIAESIRDYSDKSSVAFVDYLPFLDGSPEEGGEPTSENYLAGRVRTHETLERSDTPYVVTGHIIIEEEKSLRIPRGTHVQFVDHGLDAHGALFIEGAKQDPVRIESHHDQPEAGDWQGLRLHETAGRSRIEHATIRHADEAVRVDGIDSYAVDRPAISNSTVEHVNTGFQVNGSLVLIEGSRILNFHDQGINASGSEAQVELTGSTAAQGRSTLVRDGTCVRARTGATVTTSETTVARCDTGLDFQSPSIQVAGSVITENKTGTRVRTVNNEYPSTTVTNNDIHNNEDWNVYVESGNEANETELTFTENWWDEADSTAIANTIRDQRDDDGVATAVFNPFADEKGGTYNPGDLNRDGRVDGYDLSLLAASFGLEEEDEGFNPDADINDEGRVDGFDLALLGVHFGELGTTLDPEAQLQKQKQLAGTSQERPDGEPEVHVQIDDRSYSEGDTLRYEVRVEDTPSLFAFSATYAYHDRLKFERDARGDFLEAGQEEPIVLGEADGNEGAIGVSRTRSGVAGSPAGDGVVAELVFTATQDMQEAPTLGLREVALIAPDGHTTYGVKNMAEEMPVTPRNHKIESVALHKNYPNPARQQTTIEYELPEKKRVTLTLYDVLGRRVKVLAEGIVESGRHEVEMDASRLSSGTYFYRLRGDGWSETGRMQVIR